MGSPGPKTLAGPNFSGQGYWAGAWQGHPSASSFGSFLLPAGTCLGWERRVPGSDPDAGSAPAWSTRGQSQRGLIPRSAATSPGPELLSLAAPWQGVSLASVGGGRIRTGLAQSAGLVSPTLLNGDPVPMSPILPALP